MTDMTSNMQHYEQGARQRLDSYGDVIGDAAQATPFQRARQNANSILAERFKSVVPDFRLLLEYKQAGWNSAEGDQYYQQQRERADNADTKQSDFFFEMMKTIGDQLNKATGAFQGPSSSVNGSVRILDFCAAPGGFLSTALAQNPGAHVCAFSLPVEEGGHRTLVPLDSNIDLQYLDITMLVADMGIGDANKQHPNHDDANKFCLVPRFAPDRLFDITICDGQVLRTHIRSAYRATTEACRLSMTQLALGLQHLRPGGSMVVLLHKVEMWDTVSLLYTFSKFSHVQLHKPDPQHATRSSFYLVATNVQSQHHEAIFAVKMWKDIWEAATLATEDDLERSMLAAYHEPEILLSEFGDDLIKLARPVWDVQLRALARAPWNKRSYR